MRRCYFPLSLLVLTACTVGSDYTGPPQPAAATISPGAFVRAADPSLTRARALDHWWLALEDATLTALIEDALTDNPDLDMLKARVRQAQAVQRGTGGRQLRAGTSVSYVHADLPGTDVSPPTLPVQPGGRPLDLLSAGFTASWEPDLFGEAKRRREQASAALGGSEAALADGQVALTTRVADAYLALREAQARGAVARTLSDLNRRSVALIRVRIAGGAATQSDLASAQIELDSSEATAAAFRLEFAPLLDQLSALTGREPGALDAILSRDAPIPLPPAEVPIGDPGALIAYRPDVRRAERELAARTAGVAIQRVALFPTVRFLGLLGFSANASAGREGTSGITSILLPRLDWSFLNIGRTRALIAQADAQREEAAAGYRAAVLGALQDANESLHRFGGMRQQVDACRRAEMLAAKIAQLQRVRQMGGSGDALAVVKAERQHLQAVDQTVEARVLLTRSFVAVQKALGLGWRH